MSSFTKSELIKKLSANTGLSASATHECVNSILETITYALARGVRTEMRGFGAFSVRKRGARMGRNPRTGGAVPVPAKYVPCFKAGKVLAKAVDSKNRK